MRRQILVPAALLTIVSGCGDSNGSVLAQTVSTGAAIDSTLPLPATTAGPAITSAPVTAPPDVDLTIIQLLARYDGARPVGTANRNPTVAFPGCPGFLELIEPIIGEDIAAFTEERYGFGHGYAKYSCVR
ncbi:MAG: hypothetical protein MUP76_05215 [Acidimicrobiia bacterium]|nr:hypothetical protein [Acidimicrobiia bacterium]